MVSNAPNILVYVPADPAFDRVAAAAQGAGARLVSQGPGQRQGAWPRLVPGDDLVGAPEQLVLGAQFHLAPGGVAAALDQLSGRTVWVEVLDEPGGVAAASAGASGLIACGFEGPGLVAEETGLVLLRRLLRATDLPVIVRGGVGPDSAAAVVAAGAAGVALEQQLWLCPESPMQGKLRGKLERFNPTDTRCLGVTLGLRYRVFAQIATKAPRRMLEREAALAGADPEAARRDFLAELLAETASEPWAADLKQSLIPWGQEAALAAPLTQRHEDVAGILGAIRERVLDTLGGLLEDWPLAPGRGMAQVNDTRLPLHQGPMAQVSDTPAFARAVAQEGLDAVAGPGQHARRGRRAHRLGTGEALDGRPFGAGIIGLDANRFRDEHIAMLKRAGQTFPNMMALVAAGTAEQAMQLESAGVRTYLHTPTPGVLRAAIAGGQRRFLLEGAEAGGHIGKLGGLRCGSCAPSSSRPRSIAARPRSRQPAVVPGRRHLRRGGRGRGRRHVRRAARARRPLGIQMGTAYLMTEEAVASGAITEAYHRDRRALDATFVMGETVGAPTRVLPTQAADDVFAREKKRLADGVRPQGAQARLRGRQPRRAARGRQGPAHRQRRPRARRRLRGPRRDEQMRTGLFHCGQGIALLDQDYHRRAPPRGHRGRAPARRQRAPRRQLAPRGGQAGHTPRTGPQDLRRRCPELRIAPQTTGRDDRVAIVGLGAQLPGALDVEAFWRQRHPRVDAVTEVPRDRWRAEDYWDSDRDAPDKTYSKIGGWVTDRGLRPQGVSPPADRRRSDGRRPDAVADRGA